MCYVRSEDRISKEELITRLKLNSMRECLFDRTLQWFGDLEKREESAWSSEYGTFKDSGSFPAGRPRATWNEVFRSNLKERKVSKDIAKDRNAWKTHKKPSNPCKHGKQTVKRI